MRLVVTPQAEKQYRKIPPRYQVKIKTQLNRLRSGEKQGKPLKGKMKDRYSLKVWPYRVLYIILDDTVYVTTIAHRQGVYR